MLFIDFFLQRPANQTSGSVCTMPSCTVRSHSALQHGRPFISIAVSHGKAILDELQGKLLYDVLPDLKAIEKQICP